MGLNQTIKIEKFEGPFELLFHLIEKNKIDIYDIPIFDITNQYLAYINKADELDLELASEFLVMASTLMHIKSRMLLPKLKEEEETDPREELVSKLLEYKVYKEIAEYLKGFEGEAAKSYFRNKQEDMYKKDVSIIVDADINKLSNALKEVLKKMDLRDRINKKETFEIQLKKEKFTIEDRIEHMRTVLKGSKKLQFLSLFSNDTTKNEVITTFLALLELLKLRFAAVEQDEPFSDILIYRL